MSKGVLALALLGATCTHGPPVGGWSYGIGMGMAMPATSIKVSGGEIAVRNDIGNRMFTSTESVYDESSMKLKSVKQTRSCCGSYWSARVVTNDDGSLDVETTYCCAGMDTRDVTKESRPHLIHGTPDPLLSYSFALVPWLYKERHVQSIDDLSFFPLTEQYYWLKDPDASTRPDGVPKGDRGVELRKDPNAPRGLAIWYDPCTYIVDAFDYGGDNIQLRSH